MNFTTIDINKFLDKNYFIIDNYLEEESLRSLHQFVMTLHHSGQFSKAKIGENSQLESNSSIRGDEILWIDPYISKCDALKKYIDSIVNLRMFLNESLYCSLKSFESHFAVYPKGTFYKAHKDYHHQSRHRLITCILYLSSWVPRDGGELVIWDDKNPQFKIEPQQNRFICFNSKEVIHEVLPFEGERRISVTGWLRDDEDIFQQTSID